LDTVPDCLACLPDRRTGHPTRGLARSPPRRATPRPACSPSHPGNRPWLVLAARDAERPAARCRRLRARTRVDPHV